MRGCSSTSTRGGRLKSSLRGTARSWRFECEGRTLSIILKTGASASEAVKLSALRPHPEEPERSEGVSKDGRESKPVAMVRDGALRAPPHHEAERVKVVPDRQNR